MGSSDLLFRKVLVRAFRGEALPELLKRQRCFFAGLQDGQERTGPRNRCSQHIYSDSFFKVELLVLLIGMDMVLNSSFRRFPFHRASCWWHCKFKGCFPRGSPFPFCHSSRFVG